jgi:hypothetical protein
MSPREMKKRKRLTLSLASGKVFEEAKRQKEMATATEAIDTLRTSSKTPRWSGAKQIRKWRDASKSS